jgi:serine-type D-Ala-D-Ala carboxypeptidase/endopeptidase (penicillin-binding protein 4)
MRKKANLLFGALLFLLVSVAHAAPAPRALPPATEAKIKQLLAAPELQGGHVGVLISALGSAATPQVFPAQPYDGKTQPILFSQNADKRFLPASNMKLFTSAMALKALGPEKTFATKLLKYEEGLDYNEHYVLRGGGDPSLDDMGLQDLANQVAGAGVKNIPLLRVDGSVYGAESFSRRYPDGWTLDDTLWYYGPEINALAYNRNQVDVSVTGGKEAFAPTQIVVSPALPDIKILNATKTDKELASHVEVSADRTLPLDGKSDAVWITGYLAPNETATLGVAMPAPLQTVCKRFASLLEAQKIAVKKADFDSASVVGFPSNSRMARSFGDKVVASHQSPPLRELLKRLLKNSDNLYAEMMLRNAAVYSLPEEKRATNLNYAARGHQLIFDWLKENNLAADGLKFTDGSGLSRYNLVTPRAVFSVLAAAEKLPGANAFYEALPIAGVDGTMKNRMKGTAAENNARAKSGTFSIVSCLSGYVTTRDGHRLSVVILTNFVPDGKAARRFQDEVFTALAEAKF